MRRESGSGLQKKYCSSKCRSDFWRKNNRARDIASKRKYWLENRDKHNANGLARYYRDKDKLLARQKVRYQETRLNLPWRIPFNAAKARAKSTGIPFDLTHKWAIARWTGKCEITNIEFKLGRPMREPKTFTPSIDRIKPKAGYLQTNCRFILQGINSLKSNDTDETVLFIARAIVNRLK